MIVEWDNVWDLITPAGTLPLNQLVSVGTTPLGYYVLDRTRCSAGAARRITRNNIAQANGEITHRKFKTGFVLELNLQLWETIGSEGKPACGGVLREMADLLDLHLNAIENDDGRIYWRPSSWPTSSGPTLDLRMVDQVRTLGPSGQGESGFVSVVVEHDAAGPLVNLTFALLSPLPYAMDFTQTDTQVAPSGTLIDNAGNTNFYPVLKVHGPTSAFTLQNDNAVDELGNALKVVYNSTLPGAVSIAGGHYAEIDFFRNTIYLDGNGANLKAGIDIAQTDFWPIVPGLNFIDVVSYVGGGNNIELLWQPAYN